MKMEPRIYLFNKACVAHAVFLALGEGAEFTIESTIAKSEHGFRHILLF